MQQRCSRQGAFRHHEYLPRRGMGILFAKVKDMSRLVSLHDLSFLETKKKRSDTGEGKQRTNIVNKADGGDSQERVESLHSVAGGGLFDLGGLVLALGNSGLSGGVASLAGESLGSEVLCGLLTINASGDGERSASSK